jgi:hypothetical protein
MADLLQASSGDPTELIAGIGSSLFRTRVHFSPLSQHGPQLFPAEGGAAPAITQSSPGVVARIW